MRIRRSLAFAVVLSFTLQSLPVAAENAMGYRLLSQQEAAGLPHNRGALGLDVQRAQRISDSGLTFELMRVTQVRRDSAGAQAGFHSGDQIIAVDGRVFPSIAAFAAYIGSMQPGKLVSVDYMPAASGPQQAQRVTVAVGPPGQQSSRTENTAPATGLTTGQKLAIGAGAVALFGCYEMGCFSRRNQANQPQRP